MQLPWAEGDAGDVRFEFIVRCLTMPCSLSLLEQAERIALRNVLHVQSISEWAAACIGPYAQAVSDEGCVVLSGQIGLHPPTMQLVSPEPEAQCACALRNLAAVLEVMGSQPAFVMAVAIFVTDEACASSSTCVRYR